MVISTVNARRPGADRDDVYGLCPNWFDYIDEATALRMIAEAEIRKAAERAAERATSEQKQAMASVAVAAEDDPLAGIGF